MNLIFITPFSFEKSRPLDDRDTVRSGQNGRLRKTDKQTVFHDPGNARWRKRFRAFPGSWNTVCLSVLRRRPFWPDRTVSRSSSGRDFSNENGVMKMRFIQAIKL